MKGRRRRLDVVDELERLRADDAVERLRRDLWRLGQVGDDCGPVVLRTHIEHITRLNAVTTKRTGIVVAADLEHPPLTARACLLRNPSM